MSRIFVCGVQTTVVSATSTGKLLTVNCRNINFLKFYFKLPLHHSKETKIFMKTEFYTDG